MDEIRRELVLTLHDPPSGRDRRRPRQLGPEQTTRAAVEPLFWRRPAQGERIELIAVQGEPTLQVSLHAPWLVPVRPPQVLLDDDGGLRAFCDAEGGIHAPPEGAGRDWLRERIAAARPGMLEVVPRPLTPWGATWAVCMEAKQAGRRLVRLSLPTGRTASAQGEVLPAWDWEVLLHMLAFPLLVVAFLALLPILAVGVRFCVVWRWLLGRQRRHLQLRARSRLERRLFAQLTRCPACGAKRLAEHVETFSCLSCGSVVQVELEEPAEAPPRLQRVGPTHERSELIDLWGWIELAESRARRIAACQGPCPADTLEMEWELVQCLTEALKLLPTDGAPEPGAFFSAETRGLAAADPERCSRKRVIGWLFELPALADLEARAAG